MSTSSAAEISDFPFRSNSYRWISSSRSAPRDRGVRVGDLGGGDLPGLQELDRLVDRPWDAQAGDHRLVRLVRQEDVPVLRERRRPRRSVAIFSGSSRKVTKKMAGIWARSHARFSRLPRMRRGRGKGSSGRSGFRILQSWVPPGGLFSSPQGARLPGEPGDARPVLRGDGVRRREPGSAAHRDVGERQEVRSGLGGYAAGGQKVTSGKGPAIAWSIGMPPAAVAGKNLRK